MSDLWADVRAEIYKTITVIDPDKAEALLADADALLAVARDQLEIAKGVYEDVPFDDLGRPLESWNDFLSRRYPALAALPEHLKTAPPNQE